MTATDAILTKGKLVSGVGGIYVKPGNPPETVGPITKVERIEL